MKRGSFSLVDQKAIDKMISEGLEEIKFGSSTFSTKKVDGAIPTKRKTKSGKEIYIHP